MRMILSLILFDLGCWIERLGTPEWLKENLRKRQKVERMLLINSFHHRQ